MADDNLINEESSKETNKDVITAKINSVKKSIESQIKSLTIKARINKYGAVAVQSCIIVCSVITPILIGWTPKDDMLNNYALICSAVTAGGTMIYNFFSYRDLWVEYKISRNEFITLLAELEYLQSSGPENIDEKKVDALFQKYIQIRNEIGKNYRRIRSDKDIPNPNPKSDTAIDSSTKQSIDPSTKQSN
ncbi:SLATT domain-containing protein [Flavobacterium sp. N1736]|uniref:SLATT domain-containing protein n=1 Tax=Flavobacterium sp. N1736 TaxID=2986823 RepID=UPI0022241A1E|nr:SLATT domain-containing protein [Flavobacterium sp. N1736]